MVRRKIGFGAVVIGLMVGVGSLAPSQLHAEVSARLAVAPLSLAAAFLASAESFQTPQNNWIVVLHDANIACPAGMIMGGRPNACSVHPVFRDVEFCFAQGANGTEIGQSASWERITVDDLPLCR